MVIDHVSEPTMSFLSNNELRELRPATEIAADLRHLPSPAAMAGQAPEPTTACPGRIRLDAARLRELRQTRLMSQQDLANDFWRRNIQVSIATIKRAEAGQAVRYRVARELARYFDLPPDRLVGSVASPEAR
ncbi:MAG: helix-turn-helix transcriptional regulator [Xanthomonadaceae bacterium]|nr:helix-turn-helix transcriptional regulator [Xanthomonadaceae bacterium]